MSQGSAHAHEPPSPERPTGSRRRTRWLLFALRWGVAIVGITWVVGQLSLWDRVLIYDPQTQQPIEATLAETTPETAETFPIIDPSSWERREVDRAELLTRPDRRRVTIHTDAGPKRVDLLAIRPFPRSAEPRQLLIEHPDTGVREFIDPPAVVGGFRLRIPYPRVEVGLVPMVRQANPAYLWLAVLIFPVTFLLTSVRWYALLRGLEIHLRWTRTFVLNMVGAFYNTFMPGSTGGDVLKAWYAARHAPGYRTRAVMSVVIDRVIGLITLAILGGLMASLQWHIPECRAIALAAAALLVGLVLALIVFYHPLLRKFSGLGFLIDRLPMQRQVQKSVEAMEIYRRRPLLVLGAVALTMPVHMTVVLSALLAGTALGLPLHPMYYWVAVPVIVLAASIPIAPQGAGVMEFFAVVLTRTQGASVSEALALALSIRLVQVLWNLTGGIFVFRGGYHAPTEAEQAAMELDSPASPLPITPTIGEA